MDPRGNFVAQVAAELRYQDIRAIQYCTAQVFSRYPTLTPGKETYTREDGYSFFVLSLVGTIPTTVRGVVYHTPIKLYLMPDFPRSAPQCFVNPTRTMIVERGHPHVRGDGKILVPTLASWTPMSNVIDVLMQLSSVFSAMPPLKAAPLDARGNPILTPPAPAPAPYPSPYPAPGPAPYPAPAPTPAGVTDPKADLIRRITPKLQAKIRDVLHSAAADMNSDTTMQAKLEARSKVLTELAVKLQAEEVAWSKYAADLGLYQHQVLEWLTENEHKVVDDADSMAVPTDAVSQQLMDAVAESNACEEALYYLRKLLDRERITLEEYLKETRNIARRQFAAKTMTFRLSAVLAKAV